MPDAENLAWKLVRVLAGRAPGSCWTRTRRSAGAAALENLPVTDATMRFMVPSSPLRRRVRNAVLHGSVRVPALRRRVNSGRLAEPFTYGASPIVEPGLGQVAPDASLPAGGRLRDRLGRDFVALLVSPDGTGPPGVLAVPADSVPGRRYAPGGVPAGGRLWLIRPDGHLAARRDPWLAAPTSMRSSPS